MFMYFSLIVHTLSPFPNYQHVNEVWQRFQVGNIERDYNESSGRGVEIYNIIVGKHFYTYLLKHILNRLKENEVIIFSGS